jgi:hypothetical protein
MDTIQSIIDAGHDHPESSPRFPQAKGESDRAYEAFRVYLELGPQRRYAAVGRKVGACLRTIQRWADDFDWQGRIKSYAARCAEQYAEAENAMRREDFLDTAARARAFRDRQYAVAEAVLNAAERYLEQAGDDLDQMSFADACRALQIASRVGHQAAAHSADDTSAPDRTLRDQLAALLDQAYREVPAPHADGQPCSANPSPAQS